LRPRFFNARTISSSFLGRGRILFSDSLTGVRLSLGRRSGVTVSFFSRTSSFDLDRVCFGNKRNITTAFNNSVLISIHTVNVQLKTAIKRHTRNTASAT
jgi:hypothetical protein